MRRSRIIGLVFISIAALVALGVITAGSPGAAQQVATLITPTSTSTSTSTPTPTSTSTSTPTPTSTSTPTPAPNMCEITIVLRKIEAKQVSDTIEEGEREGEFFVAASQFQLGAFDFRGPIPLVEGKKSSNGLELTSFMVAKAKKLNVTFFLDVKEEDSGSGSIADTLKKKKRIRNFPVDCPGKIKIELTLKMPQAGGGGLRRHEGSGEPSRSGG